MKAVPAMERACSAYGPRVCVCVFQGAEHDCHLTQTNMKIDTEVAGLKTMLESHKLDTIKYLAGRSRPSWAPAGAHR